MKLLIAKSMLFFCLFTMINTYGGKDVNELTKVEIRTKVELLEGIIGEKWHLVYLAFLISGAEMVQNKVVENDKLDSIAYGVIEKNREIIEKQIAIQIDSILTIKEQETYYSIINEPIFWKVRNNYSKKQKIEANEEEKELIADFAKKLDFKKIEMISAIQGKLLDLVTDTIGMEFMGKVLGKIK